MHGNKQPDAQARITRALRGGPLTAPQLIERTTLDRSHVNRVLSKMVANRELRMRNGTPCTYELIAPRDCA